MWDLFRKLFDLLDTRGRRRALLLLGMMVVMAFLETLGVASIMPFVAVVADPTVVETNRYFSFAYEWFGFKDTQDFLFFLGLVVFGVVIGSTGFKALTTWAMVRFTAMRNYTLSCRLFEGYLNRPYEWFLTRHSAVLGKTVLSEVGQVISGALLPAMQLIAQSTIALFLIALLLLVDAVLALTVSIVVGGAYGLIFWISRRYLLRIGEDRVRANRERFQLSNEALGGIKDVKILGLENAFLRRFEKPSLRFVRHQAAGEAISQLPQYALQAIAFGGALLVVQYQLVMYGGLGRALPLIALYAVAASRLLPALQKVYQCISKLRFTKPALNILHADLERMISATGIGSVGQIEKLAGTEHRLELRDVGYHYAGATAPALRGISMTIPAHSMVGLVGHTGAGKTTLVDLILGLLDPDEGELLVDDVPIGPHNRRAWQRCLGYVPQQIFLADDSVVANIAFGIPNSDIDLEAVERAARIANLHQFVTHDLEHGYQTRIGERGMRLSGGERQRVGIARALYHDPTVLIMDEATSALDNITERAVMDAVDNLVHRKTIILIAHRLTTVRRCDTIFVLDRGRISESGSYDSLVGNSLRFREMAHE
jgi:ABC-type bacteriocin/lantibiotic exporter with double-glycine peptidase domain